MLQLGAALRAEEVSDVWNQQEEEEEGVQENININNDNYISNNKDNDRIQENQIPPVQPPPNSHHSPAPEQQQQQQAPKWHPSMVRISTQSRGTFQSIKPQTVALLWGKYAADWSRNW